MQLNDRVNRATALAPALGFSEAFKNASVLTADTIRPGDTLGLTIWENVDDGLLASAGANSTTLEEVQVDSAGFIFVPYAGRVRAAGNTVEQNTRIAHRRPDDRERTSLDYVFILICPLNGTCLPPVRPLTGGFSSITAGF